MKGRPERLLPASRPGDSRHRVRFDPHGEIGPSRPVRTSSVTATRVYRASARRTCSALARARAAAGHPNRQLQLDFQRRSLELCNDCPSLTTGASSAVSRRSAHFSGRNRVPMRRSLPLGIHGHVPRLALRTRYPGDA
jgi:hypothetical protein